MSQLTITCKRALIISTIVVIFAIVCSQSLASLQRTREAEKRVSERQSEINHLQEQLADRSAELKSINLVLVAKIEAVRQAQLATEAAQEEAFKQKREHEVCCFLFLPFILIWDHSIPNIRSYKADFFWHKSY